MGVQNLRLKPQAQNYTTHSYTSVPLHPLYSNAPSHTPNNLDDVD